MEKGVISFKETPTAPKDAAWDGPGEVASASIDDLKVMCAWVDSSAPDVKGSYKLPHHRAGGDHAVVWRGVANAMARLSQTQIPDSDKRGVYNHLAKHYAQFDETPPEAKEVGLEDFETKHVEAFIEKAADGLVAVASTNTTDRHGEIVDNNGWDLKAFKKNPVILWGHDHSQLPIGVSSKTWVEGDGKKAQLMIKPVFHEETEQARAVKSLVDQGVLKALSVGFRPLESPDGVTFTKNELLEVSVVNVPANADAMMMAYKSLEGSGFKKETIESLGIKAMDEATMRQSMTGMKGAMSTMQQHMDAMASAMGMDASKAVIDAITEIKDDVEEIKTQVKAQQSVNPSRERLSLLKVVSRASDKILEAENKHIPVNRIALVKAIKKAAEIMTVAEKENL